MKSMAAKSDSAPPVNVGMSWLREELAQLKDDAARREYVDARIEGIKETSDRIRSIAAEARDLAARPHECSQQDVIKRMERSMTSISDTIDKWKTVKLGVTLSALVLVVSAVGQWYALNTSVVDTRDSVSAMDRNVSTLARSVDKLEDSNSELRTVVTGLKVQSESTNQRQLDEIRKVLEEVVKNGKKK